jgi:uncharacterized protein YegP (UPF0339 family)
MADKAQFEIFKDKADPSKFRFRFRAKNGEIVAQSEAYNSKDAAKNGIRVIRTESPGADDQDLT